ncbi:DUF4397 domain-containing protein [bacterium]|nr:DUF4397 domain-containing protein [bacterium]
MRKLLRLLALVTLLAPFASAQEYSITLDDPTGVSAEGTIDIGTTVTFPMRFNVDGSIGGSRLAGFTNGFRVYSPDNSAQWSNLTPYFDSSYINSSTYAFAVLSTYNPDGQGADTVSYSGIAFGTGLPIPAGGFSQPVLFLKATIPNNTALHNSTICLDSVATYPPSNAWKWGDGLIPSNDIFPTFSGPHCYTIKDPNASSNLPPTIGTLPDTAVTEGDLLEMTVEASDPDGTTPTLSAPTLPSGASFTDNGDGTGSFSWQTAVGDAGVYTAIFEATDGEETVADTVQITVNELPPAVLVVDPASFAFSATEGDGNPPTQSLAISEQTGRAVDITLTKAYDWLTLSAASGATPASIDVSVDITGLAVGTYRDTIIVNSPDADDPVAVPVELTIAAAPQFIFTPDTVFFSGYAGGPLPPSQDVQVAVEGDLNVTADLFTGAAYIALDPTSLTTPNAVTVSVDLTTLTAGMYLDSILASEGGIEQKGSELVKEAYIYVVTDVGTAPEYVFAPDTVYLTAESFSSVTDIDYIMISVSGGLNVLSEVAGASAGYLSFDDFTFTTPTELGVILDASTLAEGTYFDSVLIREFLPKSGEEAQQVDEAYFYVVSEVTSAPIEYAQVQFIHNAADPALSTVDVWVNGEPFLDDFTFRHATPFTNVPAGVNLTIGFSASDDPTILASYDVMFDANVRYVAIAAGVLDTSLFGPNVEGRPLTVNVYALANARAAAIDDSTVEFSAFHGVTDFASVAVEARGVATLVDSIGYGEFSDYVAVPPGNYVVDLTPPGAPFIAIRSYQVDLSGLGGGTAIVFASGFGNPANNQNGPAVGLFAALVNGTVIEFPTYEEPCTEIMISDTVFAFEAPEGGMADPESRTMIVMGSPAGDGFDFTVTTDTNTVVSFVNVRTGDTGETVTGTMNDSILVIVDASGLSVGQHVFGGMVSSTDENVCDPGMVEFTVLVDVNEVIIPSDDTVRVATVPAVPGMRVTVPVNFVNSCPVSMMTANLLFNANALHIDSISLDMSRVADEINTFDVDNDMGMISLMTEADMADIAVGSGNWVNLHVTVKCETPGGFYPIYVGLTTGTEVNPMFDRNCGMGSEIEQPEFVQGGVVVDTANNYVCGYVVDTAGNAIEGATVELWGTFPIGSPIDDMLSTSLGSFGFGNFTTIPFALYAYADGYYPALAENLNFGDKGIMLVLTPLPELTPTSMWVDYYCDGGSTFRGEPLPIGSVIEAWASEGTLLVGRQFVTDPGSYSFMPVYRASEQFGDDGAVTGEMITFTVNGMPATPDANTVYPADYAQIALCLAVGDVVTQECTLSEGWNLVSWHIDTETDDIETLFGPYMDHIDVILGFERGGLTYDPDLTEFSTLWMADHLSGYWIRVKEGMGFTMVMEGMAVPVSTPIPVTTGWNLVSYLPETVLAPDVALASLDGILLWAYGFDGGILSYSPTMTEFNTLDEMMTCNGYWVKVSGNGTLVYPGGAPVAFASSYILPNQEELGARNAQAVSTAAGIKPTTQWVNLYSSDVTVDGNVVAAGSTIEAFTSDGKLVGSFDVLRNGSFGFMPVYGKSSEAEVGVETGQSFYLEIDGARINETFTWTGNGDRIEISALTSQSAGSNTVPDSYELAQNYPNPFNPSTVISFSMPSAGHAKIEVYNVLGHRVTTLFDGQAGSGTTEVVWNGRNERGETVSSGVYFYRLTTDSYTDTKKMMLLK